jgi:hypothetical protein
MFERLFGRKAKSEPKLFVAQLNARLQPLHRGEYFEDPLEAAIKPAGLGEVCGGGSSMTAEGEIEYCDVEIEVAGDVAAAQVAIIAALEAAGAPRGSKLHLGGGESLPFGRAEGLAVYLNGTDLPAEVYETTDSNHVLEELERLQDGKGRVLSWWQGPTETALYLYGDSFEAMHARIAPFLASYPLCRSCRVVQIA